MSLGRINITALIVLRKSEALPDYIHTASR